MKRRDTIFVLLALGVLPLIALTARYHVPAIYPVGKMVEEGGLISYGVESRDQFRRADLV
jgi:hypothetical protein